MLNLSQFMACKLFYVKFISQIMSKTGLVMVNLTLLSYELKSLMLKF